MTRARSVLGPLAATWLLWLVVGLAGTPVLAWVTAPADLIECTCVHDDSHTTCPMHHRPDARCVVGGVDDDTAVLSALMVGAGILRQTIATIAPPPLSAAAGDRRTPAPFQPADPDSPPPRA